MANRKLKDVEHRFENPTSSNRLREKELEWRRTHTSELSALAGQWVILEGDNIVVHGTSPAALITEARGLGVKIP
jgi:hypothetical protein